MLHKLHVSIVIANTRFFAPDCRHHHHRRRRYDNVYNFFGKAFIAQRKFFSACSIQFSNELYVFHADNVCYIFNSPLLWFLVQCMLLSWVCRKFSHLNEFKFLFLSKIRFVGWCNWIHHQKCWWFDIQIQSLNADGISNDDAFDILCFCKFGDSLNFECRTQQNFSDSHEYHLHLVNAINRLIHIKSKKTLWFYCCGWRWKMTIK